MLDHQFHYADHVLTTGFYEHHIVRWLDQFDAGHFYIVNGDDMLVDPGRIVEEIQDFLGLPKLLLRQDFVRDPDSGFFCYKSHRDTAASCLGAGKTRTRNGKVKTANATMERLNRFYKPHIQQLEKLLNREFGWGKGN